MSTKTEIVVCRASYRKVFSTTFQWVSFSTATPVHNSYVSFLFSAIFFLAESRVLPWK